MIIIIILITIIMALSSFIVISSVIIFITFIIAIIITVIVITIIIIKLWFKSRSLAPSDTLTRIRGGGGVILFIETNSQYVEQVFKGYQ